MAIHNDLKWGRTSSEPQESFDKDAFKSALRSSDEDEGSSDGEYIKNLVLFQQLPVYAAGMSSVEKEALALEISDAFGKGGLPLLQTAVLSDDAVRLDCNFCGGLEIIRNMKCSKSVVIARRWN